MKLETPLFCVPEKLFLQMDNFVDILDAQIKKFSAENTADEAEKSLIEHQLLTGLRLTFPCAAK